MKLKKRCFSLIVAAFMIMTCFCVPVLAANTNLEPIITVNEETRAITISGDAFQAPGTVVSLALWFPGKSAENLASGEAIATVNAHTAETLINASNAYSYSFKMADNAPSGTYTLTIYIPGYAEPQEETFSYRNLTRAQGVLDTVNSGNAAAIMSALNGGMVDIDVETSESYNLFTESTDQGYIAAYVEANRPADGGYVDADSLASNVKTVINQLNKTREIAASGNRETVCKAILTEPNDESDGWKIFLLTEEDIATYNALTKTKQEQVIAAVTTSIKENASKKIPENIRDAFRAAVTTATAPNPPFENSQPGGQLDGPIGRPNTSLQAGADVQGLGGKHYPLTATDSFNDLGSCEWAKDEINTLAGKGIVSGMGDGTFKPNANIKREQLLHILVNAFDVRAASVSDVSFKDVVYGSWYYNSVAITAKLKLVSSMSSEYVDVRLGITRQDMVTMLYNILNNKGINLVGDNAAATFADQDAIAGYAKEAVEAMSAAGVINGKANNCFDPKAPATRAEAAKMIYEVLFRLNLL